MQRLSGLTSDALLAAACALMLSACCLLLELQARAEALCCAVYQGSGLSLQSPKHMEVVDAIQVRQWGQSTWRCKADLCIGLGLSRHDNITATQPKPALHRPRTMLGKGTAAVQHA